MPSAYSGVKLDIHGKIVNKTIPLADFNIRDDLVLDVLKRNTEVDELLYQTVLEQTASALSERVAELEGAVLTANERASKAERRGSELQNQLASANNELQQRAVNLNAVRAELALKSAELDAVVTSLLWRMIRKIGRIGIGKGQKHSQEVSSS